MVDATWLDAVHEVDLATGLVRVGAGVSLADADGAPGPPRLVRPGDPGHPAGHGGGRHRRGHPRQEPPRRRRLLLPRPRPDPGHAHRDRAGDPAGRSRPLLGHCRRHGAHRRDRRGHAPDDPGRDELHAGRHRACRRPRRRDGEDAERRRGLPVLGGLDRLPVRRGPPRPVGPHPRGPRPARTTCPPDCAGRRTGHRPSWRTPAPGCR